MKIGLDKMHKNQVKTTKNGKNDIKVIHIEKRLFYGEKHLYTKLYTISTCRMPFVLFEKNRKRKRLFCNNFPKIKKLKEKLDLFIKK